MSGRVVVFTERSEFESAWRAALSHAGVASEVARPETAFETLDAVAGCVLDGAWTGYDEDELLATVGYARAVGAPVVVALSSNDAHAELDDLLHEMTNGLVVRDDARVPFAATVLARRASGVRARFEYLTVVRRGESVLVVLGDGSCLVTPRPVHEKDDGTDVAAIELADDAATATVELSSGARFTLAAETFAARSATPRNGQHDGLNGVEVDGVRLGQRLKALRLAAGLTQAELARRTGIHRPNIARVEAGRHTPSLETLARLATAIGVSTTRVLSED